mmetsp:Transcript_11275/g.21516  ORF Transcript_11275/g.21516 Transcript_11275/m.21516 type:complete len:341 (-) Transcript_11275:46-1068(-)
MTFTLRSFSVTLLLLPTVAAFVARSHVSTSTPPRPLSHLSVTKEDLMAAQEKIDAIIMEKNCGPIFVRLAWHDSGTFDKNVKGEWPAAGGAIGSIRFEPEILHGANAGLSNAVKLLEPVKKDVPAVSYADIYQMASARSIALAGGPAVDMKYGRVDATGPEQCSPEGNLPDAEAGENGEYGGDSGTASTKDKTPFGHLRKVFYRMGFDDEGITALSGAHTFGRAYKNRSGLGKEKTKFTDGSKQMRADGSEAKYTPGGSSWTERWLIFDNSYFTTMPDENADPELLKLSTDRTLFEDDGFRPFAEKFRDSQDAFFESYAKAHKQLSEQGSKFEPAEGIKV